MTLWTVIGIAGVLLLIICASVCSGKKVKDTKDFLTGGGTAGPLLVCGTIMGSLVSSQATIGTAQLAFHYGLSAWWFTLGAGAGCLALSLCYARPLRDSGCTTELQIISREYGTKTGSLASILCAVGIFISVLAQVVACTGLITTLFPAVPQVAAVLASAAVMAVYVLFGGAWSAGIGGVIKLILLYAASILGMSIVLSSSSGIGGVLNDLRQMLIGTALGTIQSAAGSLTDLAAEEDFSARFLSLTARGAAKDIGSGISLLLGVLSTQTYAQAIWSASSDKKAKQGALLSALLIPPLGIAGICIGLFMRGHYILQSEVDALLAAGQSIPELPVLSGTIQVFPMFVLHHMPALLGGVVLGTLLITVVGGGAGLSLGMATIIVKDIYCNLVNNINNRKELKLTRLTILMIFTAAAILAVCVPGKAINDFGFLSMGLRGAVVFLPLCCALWLKGKISPRSILLAVVLGPTAVLAGKLLKISFDPLFLGMGTAAMCCIIGYFLRGTNSAGTEGGRVL